MTQALTQPRLLDRIPTGLLIDGLWRDDLAREEVGGEQPVTGKGLQPLVTIGGMFCAIRSTKIPLGWFGVALVGVTLTASVLLLFSLQLLDYGSVAFTVLLIVLGMTALVRFPAKWNRDREAVTDDTTLAPLDISEKGTS